MSDLRLDRKTEQRQLLTFIGTAIIALGIVLGIAYLRLWTTASEDLTRLLPASTRAYLSSRRPWTGLTAAMELGRWADPEELRRRALEEGTLASQSGGDFGGLPLDLVRELLRDMDGMELAVVPTAEGGSVMLFVDIRDLLQRKRVIAKLQQLAEAVDRHVGFRIDAIHQGPWTRFAGASQSPPRVVVMDPWIVFSWGAPRGLEDLLAARVGGRHDAIYRRPGFVTPEGEDEEEVDDQELRFVIDAASAWELLSAVPDDRPRPGGLVEFLDLLTFRDVIKGPQEVTELIAEMSDSALAARWRGALVAGQHELDRMAPADAWFVASVTTDDLHRLAPVVREVGFRLGRDFAPTAELDTSMIALASAFDKLPSEPGEVALIALPMDPGATDTPDPGAGGRRERMGWAVLVRSAGLDQAEAAFSTELADGLGTGYAIGDLAEHTGPEPSRVHLAVPHRPGEPPLAWRVRQGLLEIAPDRATLDRLETARRAGRTFANHPGLGPARAGMHTPSAVEFIGQRDLLAQTGVPWLALVAPRLGADFLLVASLDVTADHLALRANLGAWTIAMAIASATHEEVEAFALPGLDDRCRAAHAAMCLAWPDAVPCRPFTFGRRERIRGACAALATPP